MYVLLYIQYNYTSTAPTHDVRCSADMDGWICDAIRCAPTNKETGGRSALANGERNETSHARLQQQMTGEEEKVNAGIRKEGGRESACMNMERPHRHSTLPAGLDVNPSFPPPLHACTHLAACNLPRYLRTVSIYIYRERER